MNDNQRKILEMLAEKKISVEEAERLISLLQPESNAGGRENKESKGLPKYLRVEVKPKGENPEGNQENVNIRVPMGLIRAGMRLASVIPPSAYNHVDSALKDKGIEFDLRSIKPENIEELIAALGELEVSVESGKENVRIFAE